VEAAAVRRKVPPPEAVAPERERGGNRNDTPCVEL